MKTKNSKTVKANKSNKAALAQKGSATYIRELCAKGLSEAKVFALAVKRFPILQARERHFTPRWNAARKAAA
jgi:hypothetical protein